VYAQNDADYSHPMSNAPDEPPSLQPLNKEDIARRHNLAAMTALKIYASHDASDLGLAPAFLQPIQQFYAESSAGGLAMLLYIR
jgi:hypothetical protein